MKVQTREGFSAAEWPADLRRLVDDDSVVLGRTCLSKRPAFVARGPFLDCDFESLFTEEQLSVRRDEWSRLTGQQRKGEQLSLSTVSSEREPMGVPWLIPVYNYWMFPEVEDEFSIILEQVRQDGRTALMVKNIPNKYTQNTLLDEIDRRHKGEYDFFYLPLDPKNNCNVGYAFINFVSIESIVPFYHNFNGKRWRKFNSEKVCELKYAKMQGRQSLVQHFQNMQKDRKARVAPPASRTER